MAGVVKKFLAWSWSRLQTYELCPLKAKYGYLDKIEEPKNNAMLRGGAIHKMAQDYVEKGGRLKDELKLYEKLFKEVKLLQKRKDVTVLAEQQNALTEQWTPASWFGKDAWLRIIVDLAIILHTEKRARLVDHKTGRVNTEGAQQLELYAIWGFLTYPDVDTIDGELWFLDQLASSRHVVTFYRKDLKKLQTKWANRAKPLLKDTRFAPRKNDKCKWCWYSKAKDGPCPVA
jgi:CRISPR/Cas system-associated exonuclease Cas4 (RecB family)